MVFTGFGEFNSISFREYMYACNYGSGSCRLIETMSHGLRGASTNYQYDEPAFTIWLEYLIPQQRLKRMSAKNQLGLCIQHYKGCYDPHGHLEDSVYVQAF